MLVGISAVKPYKFKMSQFAVPYNSNHVMLPGFKLRSLCPFSGR